MTLQEAINIQLAELQDYQEAMEPDYLDAINLLVEAGKQVQFYRSIPDNRVHNLLPGETKEPKESA